MRELRRHAAANIQAGFEFRITLPAMQWESPSCGASRETTPSGNYTVVKDWMCVLPLGSSCANLVQTKLHPSKVWRSDVGEASRSSGCASSSSRFERVGANK